MVSCVRFFCKSIRYSSAMSRQRMCFVRRWKEWKGSTFKYRTTKREKIEEKKNDIGQNAHKHSALVVVFVVISLELHSSAYVPLAKEIWRQALTHQSAARICMSLYLFFFCVHSVLLLYFELVCYRLFFLCNFFLLHLFWSFFFAHSNWNNTKKNRSLFCSPWRCGVFFFSFLFIWKHYIYCRLLSHFFVKYLRCWNICRFFCGKLSMKAITIPIRYEQEKNQSKVSI